MADPHGGAPAVAGEDRAAKVLFNKYELGRLLGCGATAKVYHARNLASGQSVAIKCINKSRSAKAAGAAPSVIKREVAIMRRLRHPHILRLIEVLASRTKIYFVLELAKGGELFSRLSARGRLSEDQARRYFHQLVSAVGYCHSRGVFHRDLKPENLLLDEAGDLKVSDFGLSALLPDDLADGLLHTVCGTPAYVAPEILTKKGYGGAAVDVWSCGVILFVFAVGYLPFNDSNLMAMYRKIYRGEYRCPKWVSPELRRLIARLLDTNPETRITIDAIFHDPWFRKGLDSDKLVAMMRFHDGDDQICKSAAEAEAEAEAEEEQEERDLNAFDLISFSSGLDLSQLFDPAAERERFVSAGPAEAMLLRVETAVAAEDGMAVRRVGKKGNGGAVVEERRSGNLVAKVEVHRLSGGLVVVEVEKGRRSRKFWVEKLMPALYGPAGGSTSRVAGVEGEPPETVVP